MDKHSPAVAAPAASIDRTPAADVAATAAVSLLPPLRPATYPYHPGDLILPGYRLTQFLGRGGFGEVWRAEAPGGMGVAIKVLTSLGRREGRREYRALQTIKNIHHAHIVPLFGVWLKTGDGRVLNDSELHAAEKRLLAGGQPPAAPQPADGEPAETALESLELIVAMGLGDQTLFDRLREAQQAGHPGLPTEELLPWMQQAALALDHFNSRSRRSKENDAAVQHCDIKPQNMLLVGDVVQVCDFGLARAQGEVRSTSNTMASLAYAAPEMVSPPNDPAPTTDQYSLAVTYIELRTGKLPYAELTPMTILQTKLDGRCDLSALAPAEAVVVQRALAVDPTKRWPTCADFVRALRSSVPHGRDSLPIDVVKPALPAGPAPVGPLPLAAIAPAMAAAGAAVAPPPDRQVQPAAPRAGRSLKTAGILIPAAAAVALAAAYAAFTVRSPAVSTTEARATLERAKELERQGDLTGAAKDYSLVLATRPDDLAAELWSLQTKAADEGRIAVCLPLLEQLERLYSASPPPRVKGISRWDVVNSLAWYIATQPSATADAVVRSRALAAEALTLAGDDPLMQTHSLDTLAAATARAGDTNEAVRLIDKALDTAPDPAERGTFAARRERYRQGLPWNEP